MEELHSLDPRRQELLEARFTGAVTGNTVGSTGSTSGGAKVTAAHKQTSAPGPNAALPGAAPVVWLINRLRRIEQISFSVGLPPPPSRCICQQ